MVDAPPGAAKILGTGRRKIWRIERVRAVGGTPAILERIYLDPRRFRSLRESTVLPNALYGFYQTSDGVTVASSTSTTITGSA